MAKKANAEPSGGGGAHKNALEGQKGAAGWRRKSRSANAAPSGGGGGAWQKMNEKIKRNSMAKGLALGEIENFDGAERTISGTSIFDPVLAELAYRWFCPPAGMVLDPCAGGSVRGIVASLLSRRYVGVDLSEKQVAANQDQIELCNPECEPEWIVGDALALGDCLEGAGYGAAEFDFILTCPPYADLERYSDDPRDLSTMPYEQFREALAAVIGEACARLKEDRFACIVIGDARDSDGLLYGLPAHCVQMFEDAGLRLYNDAILVTAVASLPVRVRKQFVASRKLGRAHQYVQVYVKGDPVAATKAVGDVQFGDPAEAEPASGGDNYGAAPAALGGEI